MIQKTITYAWRRCERTNMVKRGTNKCGNQQDHCQDCGAYLVLEPQWHYSAPATATILRRSRSARTTACRTSSSYEWIGESVIVV